METKFKEKLKVSCYLIKTLDIGRYCFEGPSVYGLLYVNIPEDCNIIEVPLYGLQNKGGYSLYPVNTELTKQEHKELFRYMKSLGFTFSTAKGLNEMPIYINDTEIKIYGYFRRNICYEKR